MTLPNASTLDPATIRVMCAEEMGEAATTVEYKGQKFQCEPLNYPESADAALGLVEKMKDDGWLWESDNLVGYYTVSFLRAGGGHMATAPTLALAICRAFLKATGRVL